MNANTRKKPRGRPRQTFSDKNNLAKALDKGLVALRQIAEYDGISLNDLSTDLNIPVATLHRLLMTMELHGFVRQSDVDFTWSIGIETFVVGNAFPRAAKLLQIAHPILKDLALQTGETANLGLIDQTEVIFIAQYETHHPVRAFFHSGSRTPWHSSGIGKAIAAFSDLTDQAILLEDAPFQQFTQNTLIQEQDLIDELKQIQSLGYAFDSEERFAGMRCLGAPVFGVTQQVVAGISISGPVTRISDELIAQLGKQTVKSGLEMSRQLGAQINQQNKEYLKGAISKGN